MYVVLLRDNRAHEILPDTAKAELVNKYHPDILTDMVEVTTPPKLGDVWDGQAFSAYIPPPPPAPAAGEVRAEASRRLQAFLGARDAGHLDVLISNGTREAVRLLRKGAANWTPDEAARAAGLEALDGAIEAVRAASNVLEALDPVPADYADDARWP